MIQFKVDNHIIEVDNLEPLAKAYVIFYNYDNNRLATKFYYDVEEDKFFAHNRGISTRQLDIIRNKLLKLKKEVVK